MNKNHIELEMLGICGFYLFAELLFLVTGRCSLWSSISAKGKTLFSKKLLYYIHYRECVFILTLSCFSVEAQTLTQD